MPSKKQNRDYLRDKVIPHVREVAQRQELRMLRELGTAYTDPANLIDNLGHEHEEWEAEKPAALNFAVYDKIYAKNCNIINDKYDCGREGCLAGWYLMMSEQDRRFIPWDPQWKSIARFDIGDLARHFNISKAEAHDLFGSTGEGIERQSLETYEDEYDENGYEMGIEEIAVAELTQGEILEQRADYLNEILGPYGIDSTGS